MDGTFAGSAQVTAPQGARTVEDTGINRPNLLRLALKHLHVRGVETGAELAEGMGLILGVVSELLGEAKDKSLVEIRGANGTGYSDFVYALTAKGREWAEVALQRSQYIGHAPVTLDAYRNQVASQRSRADLVTPEIVADSLSDLVLPPELARRIGPAINSGKSILFYGDPGNGKTSVAERIARTLGGVVYLPYAIEVDGQIIKLYDPVVHRPADLADRPASAASDIRVDAADGRWVACRRPVVMVGGELTLENLEITYSASSGVHEAPLQVKANGGVFILDDLGRQRASAKDLLNRWIVPMEQGIDYLSLESGTTIDVPFDSLLIFSTNLEPSKLMDPAFLRRIPYKVEMRAPTEAEYRQALSVASEVAGLTMDESQIDYVVREVQTTHQQPLAFYQARFIAQQLVAASAFAGEAPAATQDRLDDALHNLSALPQ